MIKAKVLPLPVFAAPRTSFPFNASGSAFFWISVSTVKCAFLSPSSQRLTHQGQYRLESAVKGANRQIARRCFFRPLISDLDNLRGYKGANSLL